MTINVLPTNDASSLTNTIVSEGVVISNVTYSGATSASGIFTDGLSSGIGIEQGIILTTGDASNAVGPNQNDAITTVNNTGGDADLEALIPGSSINDTTSLEFDFETETGDLFFNFVFASEEYNEFANSDFNDVFGFFLDGENVAFIPGTDTPVSINNLNNDENAEFYNNNDIDDGGPFFDIEYDGFTSVFTVAITDLDPGTHTIKLAIGDVGDSVYDSAVFIEGNTFSSEEPVVIENQPLNPIPGTSGNDTLDGTKESDEITAGNGNDVLSGEAGDDLLLGLGGRDVLNGGAGNDELDGGNGIDTAVYQLDPNGITIDLFAGEATDGYGDSDTVTNVENIIASDFDDTITGNESANSLTGRDGNDEISGKEGNDFLVGGAGSDLLNGGAGSDSFVYLNVGEGGDIIEDFEVGTDNIRLLTLGFGSGLVAGSLPSNRFIVGTSADSNVQRFVYDDATGDLFFDADGNGSAQQKLIATLSNAPALNFNDIQLL